MNKVGYTIEKLLSVAAALLLGVMARGQELSVSTNLVGYANLGTLNMEAACGVARHWTVTAGLRYNPFTFGEGEEELANMQRSVSAGARWWPWHIYSGWWMAGKLRYQEYNFGGQRYSGASQGDRYGGSISGGFAYMIGKHFNVDLGVGLWAGYDRYVNYKCLHCGRITGQGGKYFVMPDDFSLSFSYIF